MKNNLAKDSVKKINSKKITSILGILGFAISVFNLIYTIVKDTYEHIMIYQTYESELYLQDDTIMVDIGMTISNNAPIASSIVEIELQWVGYMYKYDSHNYEQLPLNIDANNSIYIEIPVAIKNLGSEEIAEFNKNDDSNLWDYIEASTGEREVTLTTAKGSVSTHIWQGGLGGRSSGGGAGATF